ncbi:MAG: hypothetical protein ACFE0O_10635 [Opitutales bacterium]
MQPSLSFGRKTGHTGLACLMAAWVVLIGTGCRESQSRAGGPPVLNPVGEYAEIDTGGSRAASQAIAAGDTQALRQVIEQPGDFNPPTLALAAYALHNRYPERAMYFFYLAQLRARSDINKSLEPSTEAAMSVINESVGPFINRYAFNDIPRLRQIIRRVLEADVTLPRNYDPRWVALHGLGAFSRETIPFHPEERWATINARTRDSWLAQFREVIKRVETLKQGNE